MSMKFGLLTDVNLRKRVTSLNMKPKVVWSRRSRHLEIAGGNFPVTFLGKIWDLIQNSTQITAIWSKLQREEFQYGKLDKLGKEMFFFQQLRHTPVIHAADSGRFLWFLTRFDVFCAVSDWHHLSTDAALYCFMISERDYGWCCEYVSMQQNDASVHSFVSELNKCAKTQLSSVTFFILCDILYFTFWWVELGGIGIWAVLRCLSTGSGFDHACFCCLSSKSLCLRSCLVVWLSGNTLALINVVALCQTRLVSGWVTVCRWVNHLGM